MPDTRTYKVDKDVYDIPMNEVDDFLVTYPKAIEVESYKVDKDTFDIPVKEVKEFLTQYPSAKPLKKKESSIPSPPTLEESLGKELPLVPKGGTSQLPSEEPEWKPAYKQGEFYKGELDVTPETSEGFRNVGYPTHKTEIIREDKEYNKKLKEISIIPKTVQEFTEKTGIDTKIQNPEKVLSQDEQVDLYKKNDLKEFIKKQSEKGYSKIRFEGEDGRITPEFLYKPEDSYWWALMYGITDAEISALKTLSGATRILNNVSPALRTTIKALNLPEGGLPEVLADKLEQAEKKGELLNKTPDNLLGDITRSVGQLSIDIPLIMMTPSAKLGYIESATGGLVKELPGLASYFGATNALQTYNEADKQGVPEVQKILQTTKALGIGVAEGALMHNFGYISGKTGDLVKGVTGSDILGRLTNVTTNGGLFTGLTATEQLMSDKLNQRELVGSFILGAGLSMGELLKAKQKVATDRLLTETPENIRKINDVPYTVEELRQKQIEIEDLITKETNSEIKEQMQIASKTLDGYIDIKAVTKQILTDPASITKSINDDPKLSTEEKKYYIDKINQVVVENDPRLQTINPILAEVDKINRNIESVQNNELMNDVAKKATIKGLETRKEELDKEITKEMSKPLDIIELNKIEQEKSKKNEQEQKQTEKAAEKIAKESEGAAIESKAGEESQKNEILKPTENEKQEKGRQEKVLTGKEEDVTIQKQKSDEGVLRQERLEVELQEVDKTYAEQKKPTEQGKKEKIKSEDLVIESKKESTPQVKRILRDKGNLFTRELKIKDESVGNITIKEGDNWMVKRVDVESTQQGKGIATETYRQLNKEANKESKVLTSDLPDKINNESKRIWKSLVKSGEAEKLPDNTYRFKQISVLDQELAKTRKEKLNEKEEEVKARLNERLQKLSGAKFAEGAKKQDTLKELYGVINDLGELGLIKIEKGIDHIITELKKYLPDKDIEKYKVDIENEFVKKVKEEREIGIEHAATKEIREEFGFGEYEKITTTKKELKTKADEAIKKGADVDAIIEKAKKGEGISALDQEILKTYISGLDKKIQTIQSDEVLFKYKESIDAIDLARSEAARVLGTQHEMFRPEDTLGDFLVREMDNSGVDKLTKKQKETVIKEFNEISEANKRYEEKLQEYEELIARLKSEPVLDNLRKKTPKSPRRSHDDFIKEREDLKKQFTELWNKPVEPSLYALPIPLPIETLTRLARVSPTVLKIAESYLAEGIINLKDVIDNIYEDYKEFGLSKVEIHNIIAGEYKMPKKTRQEANTAFKDLQYEAKLINRLEKLQQGVESKVEKKKIERNRQITELQNQIKGFKSELTKVEKDYEKYIINQFKNKPLPKEKLPPEVIALKSLKTRTENQIKKLEQELATGNFAQPEKKVPTLENKVAQKIAPKLYKEVLGLKDIQIQRKQEREIRMLKEKYENRNARQKAIDWAVEVASTAKLIKSTLDLSAVLRQAAPAVAYRPDIALRNYVNMWKDIASESNYNRWFEDVRTGRDYAIMKESGIDLSDFKDPRLTAREEAVMNTWLEKVPVLGKSVHMPIGKDKVTEKKYGGIISASNRAYSSFLNRMRVDVFRSLMRGYENDGLTLGNSRELYIETAKLINNLTGRGHLADPIKQYYKVLSLGLWSPKLQASRINLLMNMFNPKFYTKVPAPVRKEYFKAMGRFVGAGLTMLAIAKFIFDKDVEENPISSDFGKIKSGNLRVDLWAGLQQYVVFMSRFITNRIKSRDTGKITSMKDNEKINRWKLSVNFLRQKADPTLSFIINTWSGTDAIGRPATAWSELQQIKPLWIEDAIAAYREEGAKSVFYDLANIHGLGVDYTDPKEMDVLTINEFNKKYNPNKVFLLNTDYIVISDKLQELNKQLNQMFKENTKEEIVKFVQDNNLKNDIAFQRKNAEEANILTDVIKDLSKQPVEVQKQFKFIVESDVNRFVESFKNNEKFEVSKDIYLYKSEKTEREGELKRDKDEFMDILGDVE